MAIEFVLVMAVFALLFLLLLQLAVTAFAHRAAEAAADEALAAATGFHGSAGAGESAGRDALAHVDGGLHDPNVTVRRNAAGATVTVTGDAPLMLPGMPNDVHVRVYGPVERFVEDNP